MDYSLHEQMRKKSTSLVFENVVKHGPITKKKIQENTGLSWGTISSLAATMLKQNILIEEKINNHTVGRAPNQLDINPNCNFIVGLDVNLDSISAVLTDLKSRVIHQISEVVDAYEIKHVLSTVEHIVSDMSAKVNGMDNIVGIGLALPGNVNTTNGVWRYKYSTKSAIDFPIKEQLQKKFRCHLLIDHDPNCIALAEQFVGKAKEYENFLLLRLSTGIGMSLVLNNQIYRGWRENAGEFGHVCAVFEGHACHCGKNGCLEQYSSRKAVLRTAVQAANNKRYDSILNNIYQEKGTLTLADVFSASAQGDAVSIEILERAAIHLGIAIANAVNILNPKQVILWGELTENEKYFVNIVEKFVKKYAVEPDDITVQTAEVGLNGAAVGAVFLIIQDILNGNHPLLNNL